MIKKKIRAVLQKCPKLYRVVWINYGRCQKLYRGFRHIRATGTQMTRCYCIAPGKKLVYVVNCKVASSSLKANVQDLGPIDNYQQVWAMGKGELYPSDVNIDDYPGYYFFSFVRNPFRRLVSCYENKFHTDVELSGKPGRRLYQDDLYFDQYLMGYVARDKGFKAFAKKVSKIPDKWADRHFISQAFLLHDASGRDICQFVGKMEDLPDAYEPIRQKYGMAELPHYNQTTVKTESGKWMDYYDLESYAWIYNRYQADIEQFGYQADAENLKAYLLQKAAKAQ
ncbi:MAG: sulfotransferase family 2 domain-containing protein [Clostridia bacterium]